MCAKELTCHKESRHQFDPNRSNYRRISTNELKQNFDSESKQHYMSAKHRNLVVQQETVHAWELPIFPPKSGDLNALEISRTSNEFPKLNGSGLGSSLGSSLDDGGGVEKKPGDFRAMFNLFKSQPILTSFLLCIPLGFLAEFLSWGDLPKFSLNFVAIIPQAWLMGKATEDLASHLGQIAGGLLNAWFGNVVEMLICIAGLRQGQLVVVKSTLVGSILSNLLLVTGCSFLAGGLKHKVQEFSAIGASTNASLMTLSCLCLGLPTMYAAILSSVTTSELQISRSVSFFLIIVYAQYLVFQLGTHSFLFADDDDEEEADLSVGMSACILIACTVCCAMCSELLVASIEGVVNSWNVSKEFIGIILLPVIGNAAEHYTAVVVAMRNKMDLSLACAVGSSCQMALFVTPATVLLGWAMGQPMSLDLHPFEVIVLMMAVLIITSVLQDGYSNWLEGSMLLSAYGVVALVYFFEDPQYSEIV